MVVGLFFHFELQDVLAMGPDHFGGFLLSYSLK